MRDSSSSSTITESQGRNDQQLAKFQRFVLRNELRERHKRREEELVKKGQIKKPRPFVLFDLSERDAKRGEKYYLTESELRQRVGS